MRRVYAIGDIHGRLDLFERLLAIIQRDHAARAPTPTRIVVLGDLIDRGPDSARVVEACRRFAEESDRFVVLKGNHEAIMLCALSGDLMALDLWLKQGGREALRSWGVAPEELDRGPGVDLMEAARRAVGAETLAWLSSLPLKLRHGNHLFVHAGIRPGAKLWRQTEDDLLWIRDEFLECEADHGVVVVHGHTVHEAGPDIRHNRIGLDSGAWRTGRLSAVGIEDGQVWPLMTEPKPAVRTARSAAVA